MVGRVVIARLEIIEAGFVIVVIAAITQGIDACRCAGGCQNLASTVIGVRIYILNPATIFHAK